MVTMSKRFEAIKIIGFLLALLYVTSLSFFALYTRFEMLRRHAWMLVILLAVLFVAALGIYKRSHLSRKVLIGGNILLGAYALFLSTQYPALVSWMYGLGLVAVGIYFIRKDVEPHFCLESKGGRTVLVIDDDEILTRTVRAILTSHGYSVLAAYKGEDGLHMAKFQKPDLILLDVLLPGIKGREVCRRLKDDPQTKHIPVIFITAKDSQDDIEAEMNAGGEAHLTKPVHPESLLVTIQGVLNR